MKASVLKDVLLGISVVLYTFFTVMSQITRFMGVLYIPLAIELLFLLWFFLECLWGWLDTRRAKEYLDPEMFKIRLRLQIFHSLVLIFTIVLFALDIPAAFSERIECATGFGG